MKELSEKLKNQHEDFDVTPQWLGHVLRDNNETRKRTRHKHENFFFESLLWNRPF